VDYSLSAGIFGAFHTVMKQFCQALLLLLLVAATGCREGKYDLRFQPADDSRYRLQTDVSGKVTIKMLGQELKQPMNTRISSLLRFDTLPDGNTQVAFAYEDYNLSQGKDKTMFSLDSLSQKDSAALRVMDMMTGIEFTATISPKGQVLTKVSTDSLWKVVEAGLQPLEEQLRKQLATALRPLINDDMMSGMLEQCFYVLPGKKVNEKAKWKNQIRMKAIFTMVINNDFELKSVKNGIAEIALTSTITNADQQVAMPGLALASPPSLGQPKDNTAFDIMGMKLDADFKGKQQGLIYVNLGTGLMQTARLQQHLSGIFKINSIEIPMDMDMKIDYKLDGL